MAAKEESSSGDAGSIYVGPWKQPRRARRVLTVEDLPPPDTQRWVVRRKAQVVEGVHAGLITLEEACARYSLSVEEFKSWEASLERHGLSGLRARTKQQAGDSD